MRIHTKSFCHLAFWLLALGLCFVSDLSAQMIGVGHSGIATSGSTEVSIIPSMLRLELQIQAEGRDAKSALKALSDHKKVVQDGLIGMKAEAKSIEFAGTQLSEGIAGAAEGDSTPYEMVMQRAMAMQGGVPIEADEENEPAGPPKIFTAKSRVTADWKLPTKDLDALALLPETLKAQILQRDLQGKKIKAELTEEENEALTDYQRQLAQQGSYYSGQQPVPDIRVWFVGRLEAEEEKAALKKSFEKATANAKLLAEASGMKLGKIQMISQTDTMLEEAQYIAYSYDSYGEPQNRPRSKRLDGEVLSTSAADLTRKVSVQVVFGFE